MKKFNTSDWIKSLEEIDFSCDNIANTIEEEANSLSEKINSALDKCAPMKTFKIKPKYLYGLSQEAKVLMRNRGQVFIS